MGSRHDNTRSSRGTTDIQQKEFHAFIRGVGFAHNPFLPRKDRLGAVVQPNEDVLTFSLEDDPIHKITHTIREFVEDDLSFRILDSLDDDLPCGLCRDSSESLRRNFNSDNVSMHNVRIANFMCLCER
jgi:hypothetical protein